MQSQAVDWRYPQLYNLAVLSVKLLFRNENIIAHPSIYAQRPKLHGVECNLRLATQPNQSINKLYCCPQQFKSNWKRVLYVRR